MRLLLPFGPRDVHQQDKSCAFYEDNQLDISPVLGQLCAKSVLDLRL